MFRFATNTSMSIFTHYLKHENWWHDHLTLQIYIHCIYTSPQTVPLSILYTQRSKATGNYHECDGHPRFIGLCVRASTTYTRHGVDIIECNTHFIHMNLHLDVVCIRTGKWGDEGDETDFYPENWWHCHIDTCKNGLYVYKTYIYLDTSIDHILHV